MSGRRPRLLIIEDHADLREILERALRGQYRVVLAGTAAEALRLVETVAPDLIILDLMLPDMDGFALCTRLRSLTASPILVLSARTHPRDKAQALDLGADDYLTKPFAFEELQARLRALLRRAGRAEPPVLPAPVVLDDLVIDLGRREVRRAGAEVRLTPTEFHLLAVLASVPGKVWRQSELLQRVWGPQYRREINYLRTYIRRLRRKIEPEPAHPRYIQTVSRIGYRLVAPSGTTSPSDGAPLD